MTTLPQVSSMRLPRAGGVQGGTLSAPGAVAPAGGGAAAAAFQMTPADIWRVIRANLWLILTLLVVSAAAGFAVNKLLEWKSPKYTAVGYISVSNGIMYDPLKQPVAGVDLYGLPLEQRTQAAKLSNEQLFGLVLSRADSPIRKTEWFLEKSENGTNIERAKKDLAENFDVAPVPETKLIKVSMTYRNAKDTRTVLEEVVNEHINQEKQITRDRQNSRSVLLGNMKENAKQRLNEVQREMRETMVKLNTDGGSAPGRVSAKEMELSELLKKQMEIRELVTLAKGQYDSLKGAMERGESSPKIEEYVNRDPSVQMYRQQLDSLDMTITGLSATMLENNSRLKTLQRQRDVLEQKYDNARADSKANAAQMMLSALGDEIRTAQGNLEQTESLVAKLKQDMGELNNAMQTYLLRKQEEESLSEFMKSVDEQLDTITQINQQADLASVAWSNRPDVPGRLSFPKLWLTMSMAIFLGLGLGLGIAFTREALDTTVRSPRDVARVGNLNLLGMVPDEQDDPQATGGRLPLIIFDSPHSMLAEQFRQVRTRLQHAAPLDTTRSIMVTSPSPGDGKTTVAANLAAGLALNGRKILLVDANFRRPEMAKVFGVSGGAGFSEALASPEKFASAVRTTQVPNLSVMPLGNKPANATELIESQLLTDFLEKALKDYDHVIFDSGPLLLASDAMALAPRVDGVVSVVRAQSNSRGVLQRLRDTLRQIKAEHVGVVLNGVRAQGGGYYGRNIKTYYAYQNGGAA